MKIYSKLSRSFSKVLSGTWALSEDQLQIHDLALKFADKELSPNSYEWDVKCIFPTEAFRHSASLGFGGIYCKADYGGSELSRLEASLIFECLSKGDVSFSVYLSVHNMVAWVLDQVLMHVLPHRMTPALVDFRVVILPAKFPST